MHDTLSLILVFREYYLHSIAVVICGRQWENVVTHCEGIVPDPPVFRSAASLCFSLGGELGGCPSGLVRQLVFVMLWLAEGVVEIGSTDRCAVIG